MTVHLNAGSDDIAETVLLPGDPLRAQFVAENYLENTFRHNDVRGMYGYTGTYQGKRVSVQGTGMGMPSIAIYAHELINAYGAKQLIRIGSCGAFHPELQLQDIVLAQAACTDSNLNRLRFRGMDFAPAADFGLLLKAYETAREKEIPVRIGTILSSDTFYGEEADAWKLWAAYGVLAVEMEAAALYTLAARFGVRALAVLTVSDTLIEGQRMSARDRERSLRRMIEIALDLA